MRRLKTAAIAAGLFLGAVLASKAVILFSSQQGDVNFPGLVPTGLGQYTKTVPLTGFSLTFGNNQTDFALRPAGTLAAGYVTMAPQPWDGARACIFSTQIITLLYPTANTGQTINDAVTTLAANARVCYLYSLANTTWDRLQ